MFRQISKSLSDLLDQNTPPIILVLGMRQVGKSTLALNLVKNSKYVRFNFDLPSDRLEFINQNRHDLSNFSEKYKEHIIVIDEIQKSPDATAIIKHLYDNYKTRFILTGSSEVKIRKG